jgi:hypothetical protein
MAFSIGFVVVGVACAEQALKRITISQIHFFMSEVYQFKTNRALNMPCLLMLGEFFIEI